MWCIHTDTHTHTHTHTHTMEHYSATKNEILSFASTWMDLENIMLSEKSQKDKYCMLSLIRRIKK